MPIHSRTTTRLSPAAGTLSFEFIFANGHRLARRDSSGTVHYYFSDQINSANVITNDTGSAIQSESDYMPYGGEIVIVADTTGNQYKFTGKERDTETDLDYFGARYYAHSFMRFMTPDWAASPVPIPYAQIGLPQSLNLYNYVQNNPITTTDPDGHVPPDGLYHGDPLAGDFGTTSDTADMVDAGINRAQNALENASLQSGSLAAAQTAFSAGVLADILRGFSDILRTGNGVGTASVQASNGQYAQALNSASADGGRIGGIALMFAGAVEAKGAPAAEPKAPAASEVKAPTSEPYNRSAQYGNPSSSTTARAIRTASEGKSCPSCQATMKSSTKNAPTAEHSPTLKQHWYSEGHKMTGAQRKAYARSPESYKGSMCLQCQSRQGGLEAHKTY